MTLAETLRRNRPVRSRVVPVREPADGESVESVARTPAKTSGAGPEPGMRDWIGVLAMVTGLVMAIMDVQIVTSSLTQIQDGLSASADEISWVR